MKILLIDDHLLFLEGLHLVLEKLDLPSPLLILEAASGKEALALIAQHGNSISLALVDLNFPGEDGLELVKILTGRDLLVPVIVISAEEDINRIKQAIELGALGFIPKSLGSEEMQRAISQVLSGIPFVTENIRHKLSKAPDFPPYSEEAITKIRKQLGISKRQYDTLVLLARGYSNNRIAEELHLSVNTVKSHVSILFQQLVASNRTDCMLKAKQQQLIK